MLLSFFFSEFSATVYFISITWILYEQTNNAVYTGVLVSLGFLPGLFLNLLFGVFVDRFNRKRLAIIALAIGVLAIMTLLLGSMFYGYLPILIIAVHMTVQISGSLFRPAVQALIAEIFPKEDLPKVFSKTSSFSIIGGIVGASIGGILLALTGGQATLIIAIISYIIAILGLLTVPYYSEKLEIEDRETDSILIDLKNGFQYLNDNRFLLLLFFVMFNSQLVFHTSLGFLSVYTLDYLKQTSTTYGLLDVCFSLGGVLAGIYGSLWWSKTKNKFAVYSLLITMIGLGTLGYSHYVWVSFIGVFLLGLGTTWVRVLMQAVQQMATEKAYHGRMASFRMICNQGAVVLSGPILGWIAASYGSNTVYISLMIPMGICILFAVYLSKNKLFKKLTYK